MDRLIDTRLKEHQRHIRLEQLNKSVMMKHSINFRHRHPLHQTQIHGSHHQRGN
jgi:hypothetical protein